MDNKIIIKLADITKSTSDCIVNAANQTLLGGGGVDGAIYHQNAQPKYYLASCYKNCLDLAKAHDLHSIDFPAISCGVYGYPINEACQIAYSTICTWLNENADYPMQITLSCFNQEVYDAYMNIAKTKKKKKAVANH